MRFRDKVLHPQRPVVVYEVLPPRIIDGTAESHAEMISSLLSQTHIDAINIPEVHDEETRGERPISNRTRIQPREFGRLIQDVVGIEAIINRVTVNKTFDEQKQWFRTTNEEYMIDNIILVGGESGTIDYSGPSVTESANFITEELNNQESDIFCGGITIPSRKVESARLIAKGNSGIDFFTSQVLYESGNIMKMLSYYQDECKKRGEIPKRILLSFAPVSSKKNIEFLKWLGVEIPKATEEYMLSDPDLIKGRSIETSLKIFSEVVAHISENKIRVPIGLNVEHIMASNFQYSVELLQRLSMVYRKFCIETKLFAT